MRVNITQSVCISVCATTRFYCNRVGFIEVALGNKVSEYINQEYFIYPPVSSRPVCPNI